MSYSESQSPLKSVERSPPLIFRCSVGNTSWFGYKIFDGSAKDFTYNHWDSACELWKIKTKNEFWYTTAFGKSAEHNSAESFLVHHPSFFLPWTAQSKIYTVCLRARKVDVDKILMFFLFTKKNVFTKIFAKLLFLLLT